MKERRVMKMERKEEMRTKATVEEDDGGGNIEEKNEKDKSVRRRIFNWGNTKVKETDDKSTFQREKEEGGHLCSIGTLGGGLGSVAHCLVSTRAEHEREQRQNLFKAELRRQKWEGCWYQDQYTNTNTKTRKRRKGRRKGLEKRRMCLVKQR